MFVFPYVDYSTSTCTQYSTRTSTEGVPVLPVTGEYNRLVFVRARRCLLAREKKIGSEKLKCWKRVCRGLWVSDSMVDVSSCQNNLYLSSFYTEYCTSVFSVLVVVTAWSLFRFVSRLNRGTNKPTCYLYLYCTTTGGFVPWTFIDNTSRMKLFCPRYKPGRGSTVLYSSM